MYVIKGYRVSIKSPLSHFSGKALISLVSFSESAMVQTSCFHSDILLMFKRVPVCGNKLSQAASKRKVIDSLYCRLGSSFLKVVDN